MGLEQYFSASELFSGEEHMVHHDVSFAITKPGALEEHAAAIAMHGVKMRVIKNNGPAGGNPLIRYSGPYKSVLHVLKKYHTDSDDPARRSYEEHRFRMKNDPSYHG